MIEIKRRNTDPHHKNTDERNRLKWTTQSRVNELKEDLAICYWHSCNTTGKKAKRAYIFLAKLIQQVLTKLEKRL